MWSALLSRLSSFSTIDLKELNATASYLKRIDRKFLLTEKKFLKIIDELSKDFRVLEIDGKRSFLYDNVYMDTDNYLFYEQHQTGVKNRTKIRTRHYTDAGDLAFFEYKQKENGVTKKFRYQFPAEEHGSMTKGKKRFFDGVYQSMYWEKAPDISPAIRTKYKRITLVSKDGSERLTIDFHISTKDLRNTWKKMTQLKNLVIVESKSLSKECKSVALMKQHNIAGAKACSKYSLWVIYSGLAEKWSHFSKTLEAIGEIRLEVVRNKRINEQKVEKTLGDSFKTTSLEEVSQTA